MYNHQKRRYNCELDHSSVKTKKGFQESTVGLGLFSYMENLPAEILTNILEYLLEIDKVRCERVCKRWFDTLHRFWPNDATRMRFNYNNGTKQIGGPNPKKIGIRFCKILALRENEIVRKMSWSDPSCKFFIHFVKHTSSTLKEIQICNVKFDDSASFSCIIENCPNLEIVFLSDLVFPKQQQDAESEFFLTKLITKQKLRFLDIKNCKTKDFKCNAVANQVQSNLTHLRLAKLEGTVEENDFVSLCRLIGSSLQKLSIKHLDVKAEVLTKGQSFLTNLQHMDCFGTSLSFKLYATSMSFKLVNRDGGIQWYVTIHKTCQPRQFFGENGMRLIRSESENEDSDSDAQDYDYNRI